MNNKDVPITKEILGVLEAMTGTRKKKKTPKIFYIISQGEGEPTCTEHLLCGRYFMKFISFNVTLRFAAPCGSTARGF